MEEGGGGVFFQAEDGIRDLVRSRGLGDVYKRQGSGNVTMAGWHANEELWTSVESDADDWSPFTSAVGRWLQGLSDSAQVGPRVASHLASIGRRLDRPPTCLLYTSDAADERSSVDLGGRRITQKKYTS